MRTEVSASDHPTTSTISRALAAGLAAVALLGLTSCLTTREAKSNVRTRIGFDNNFLKGRGVEADDSDKIRKKFADSGWTTDEDGKMTARNPNLYEGEEVGRGRDFKKKNAHLSKRDAEKKYFDTPEYLERQQYATDEAREGGDSAREGLFDRNRPEESGRSANADSKPGFLAGLNPFKTSTARESGDTYRTSADREGTRAQADAVVPRGVSQGELGYYSDSINTMDDVKKLLHPEAFD